MRKKYVEPQLPTKKSSVESIDIALVRAEVAAFQRWREDARADLEVQHDAVYAASLRETLRYYEGRLNSLRSILEGQFKPEE